MIIFLSIDDTDNPESIGTGKLTQLLCDEIKRNSWGQCSGISRHQLHVHKDIPYTSHNSAMCLEMDIAQEQLHSIINFSKQFLENKSSNGSNPGLGVLVVETGFSYDPLIEFGFKAKQEVVSKEEALNLAFDIGLNLYELGGTGQGVIGALAGIGLRLNGNDGRFRGWYELARPGETITVRELCTYDFIDSVRSIHGNILETDVNILLGSDKIKIVLRDSKQVLLVTELNQANGLQWQTLCKKQVKQY